MILEFKTSNKNTYSRRKYLCIDTEKKQYTTSCNSMIIQGIEIKTGDYKQLISDLSKQGYTQNERI